MSLPGGGEARPRALDPHMHQFRQFVTSYASHVGRDCLAGQRSVPCAERVFSNGGLPSADYLARPKIASNEPPIRLRFLDSQKQGPYDDILHVGRATKTSNNNYHSSSTLSTHKVV